MPRKVFVAGEILTAADVNTNLMDQAVMVFDDSAARTAAIPSPIEGMVTYLKDTDAVEKFDGSSFVGVADPPAILQVVSTTITDTFSSSSSSFTDITGLTATITPSSTSSKILVYGAVMLGTSAEGTSTATQVRFMRDSTPIAVGDASSNRTSTTVALKWSTGSGHQGHVRTTPTPSNQILDEPNTTSAVTYKMQLRQASGTGFVNRSGDDVDAASSSRGVSTITLMEVAG